MSQDPVTTSLESDMFRRAEYTSYRINAEASVDGERYLQTTKVFTEYKALTNLVSPDWALQSCDMSQDRVTAAVNKSIGMNRYPTHG